jgi:uncharacterized protein (DUF58 family)
MSKPTALKGRLADWTAPDYFEVGPEKEASFFTQFMRQLLPSHRQRTQLTRTGWFLIIVAMGIGSAAYNTASNILFMTLSLVLSSLILSGVLSLFNFRNLNWTVLAPKQVRAGEVGMARVHLENQKRFLPTMSLFCLVEHLESDRKERIHLQEAVRPGGVADFECSLTLRQRGLNTVSLTGAESEFPFGFLNKIFKLEESTEFMVWPASVKYSFSKEVGGRRVMSGSSRRLAGVGTDLLNIRPYVQGDPPRLLHWKATARLGKPMTRQLAQEGESGYWIEIDTQASQWSADSFERMCSAVCSLASDLFAAGRFDGIWFPDTGFTLVRNLSDLHDFYDRMSVLKLDEVMKASSKMRKPRRLQFRATDTQEVSIYIDETRAGQTES